MHEKITNIQNSMWMIYKEYLHDNDYTKYFESVHQLVAKYEQDEEVGVYRYAVDIGLAWVQLIGRHHVC